MFKRLTGSRLIFLCCSRWLYGTTNSPWTPHVQSSILCTEAPFLAKFNVKLMVGKTTPGWWNRCTNWCAFEFRWCCFPYKICGRVYLNSQTFFLIFSLFCCVLFLVFQLILILCSQNVQVWFLNFSISVRVKQSF